MRDRAGVLVLAGLAPATCLALDPGGLFPFGPAKWLAITTLVPLGTALLWWARPMRYATRPTVALAALVAVLAAAAVFGEDRLYAWIGTPERHLGVVLWLLVLGAFVAGQSMDDAADGPTVTAGVLVAGAGVGIVGVLEALGVGPDVLDAGSRLGSTFGSPAHLGAAACLLLPPAIALAWHRRPLAVVAAVTLGVATLGSGARAAWVGLAAAAGLAAVARRVQNAGSGAGTGQDDRELHRSRASARALGVAGAIAIGVVAVLVLTPVGGRLADTFDADAPGGAGRLDEWRVAARVIADHPVLGVGPEGYRIAFATGVNEGYEREHGRDPLPDRAHSGPLDLTLAGGLPALLAWLALLVTLGPFVWRALADERAWRAGIAAGLVAYLTGQLLLFPLAELEPVASLLAGLLVATAGTPLRARVVPRVVPAVLALLGGSALVLGILDLAADRDAGAAVDALANGDPRAALDRATDAAGLRPDEVRLHLLVARAALADDRGTVEALAAVDDALAVSPEDPVALLRRAQLLVERAAATQVPEHAEAAGAELERLLAHDPRNATLHALASAAHLLAGDAEAAERELEQARDLGFDENGTP